MEKTALRDFPSCWRSYVAEPYSARLLTKDTDIPVAISGLAARFQSRFHGVYIAGIWKDDLLRELLWFATNEKRATSFYAPTWSWMSLETGESLQFYNTYEGCKETYLANVLEAKTTPSSINPFGPVSSGSITLTGTLIPSTLMLDAHINKKRVTVAGTMLGYIDVHIDTLLVNVSVGLADGTEKMTTRRALPDEQSTQTSFPVEILPLIDDGMYAKGLLVGYSTTSGASERLGYFRAWDNTFETVIRDHGIHQTITLV
jgi:hypothetical protein